MKIEVEYLNDATGSRMIFDHYDKPEFDEFETVSAFEEAAKEFLLCLLEDDEETDYICATFIGDMGECVIDVDKTGWFEARYDY